MDLYRTIRTRKNIREFRNDAIPQKKVLRILEAANLAPSVGNRQPWNFLIMNRSSIDQVKEILDQSFKQGIEEIGRIIMNEKIIDFSNGANPLNAKVNSLTEFYRTLSGAPMAIIVYVDKEVDSWQWKTNICGASAAIENLILAAWSEGIGSCWMICPLNEVETEIKEFLRIPEDKGIIGIISIGIPAQLQKNPPNEDIRSKAKWFGS